MDEVLLAAGGVSLYTLSGFIFLAFLWSGFVFYKKAVEYHQDEEVVFNAILLMGGLSFVFARVWFVLTRLDWFMGHWIRLFFIKEYPGMSSWGVFWGVLTGILLAAKGKKEKLYGWLDLTALALSAGIPIVYSAWGGLFGGVNLIKGLVLGLWFFFLWWVEGEYRTFEWYRFRKTQARTGFVTGMFLAGFGLVNLVTELLSGNKAGWWVYAILVVVGGLVVYIRSEREIKRDVSLLQRKLGGLKWPKIIMRRK